MTMDDGDPIDPVLGPPPRLDDDVWMSAIAAALEATDADFDPALLPGDVDGHAPVDERDESLSSGVGDDGTAWDESDHDQAGGGTEALGASEDSAHGGGLDRDGGDDGSWPGHGVGGADGGSFHP
jgi:hypothetical protein